MKINKIRKKDIDENFIYGIYNLDNLEEENKVGTSLNVIVSCNLSIQNDKGKDWGYTSISLMLVMGIKYKNLLFMEAMT